MYNEPMNVAMMLACMRIGAKLALLNHKLRAQPLTHCILVVKPKLIIVGKDNALVEVGNVCNEYIVFYYQEQSASAITILGNNLMHLDFYLILVTKRLCCLLVSLLN